MRAPHEYLAAHGEVSGNPVIRLPGLKMNEMSHAGWAATPGRGALPPPGGAAGGPLGPKKSGEIGAGPIRPPDRLSHPSTLSLKKSLHTTRLDVMPPCEWPASQNAFTLARPTRSSTRLVTFCR